MLHLKVTENIVLRTFQETDAYALFNTIGKNRQHLRSWISWIDQVQNEYNALSLIRAGAYQVQAQQGLALGLFKDKAIIGAIEMQGWQQDLKKANIGYWLIKKEQGKGIMFQAASVFLTYLFEHTGLNKVELAHLPENTRSAALATRLGFKVEGVLRDSLLMNGRICDKVVQGLLKKEWQQ
jgi:ribosomal-protein-serine acetyltransferase